MSKKIDEDDIIIKDAQELIRLLGKLNTEQKKTVLNVLRGVALVANEGSGV